MTFLALPHGDTGAVPKTLFGFRFLVFIMAAGAQGGTQFVLMFGETLDYGRRYPQIHTKIGIRPLGIGFSEFPHGFQAGRGGGGRRGHGGRKNKWECVYFARKSGTDGVKSECSLHFVTHALAPL